MQSDLVILHSSPISTPLLTAQPDYPLEKPETETYNKSYVCESATSTTYELAPRISEKGKDIAATDSPIFIDLTAEDYIPAKLTSVVDVPVLKRKIEISHLPDILSQNLQKPDQHPSPRKKSPVKKPRTITGLATEKYLQTFNDKRPEASKARDDVPKEGSLEEGAKVEDPPKRKRRVKKDMPAKQASTKSKKPPKPPKPPKVPLLSPGAAASRFERQSIVFGTSSQLANGESSAFLYDLQQALFESNAENNLDQSKSANQAEKLKKSRFRLARVAESTFANGEGIWSAGALLSSDNPFNEAEESNHSLKNQRDDTAPEPFISFKRNEYSGVNQETIPAFHTTEKRTKTTFPDLNSNKLSEPQSVSLSLSQSPRTPKPRIVRKANTIVLEDEIQDSEPELSPSPPHFSLRPPTPLVLSNTASLTKVKARSQSPSKALQTQKQRTWWSKFRERVFMQITNTVMGAPRGTVDSPSWYERILMYEPIVVEDLTSWLVRFGVVLPVEEEEAHAGDVENAKNGEAKRKGKAKSKPLSKPTVHKDLQPWMVKLWCEERSICCVSRVK